MYISCNELKKHIKDSDKIDWIKIWDKFTIRSAEVDGVELKGQDIKDVIVGEIVELNKNPLNEKYYIVKLNIGKTDNITLVSTAPNLYLGMKVPCALPGGSLKGVSEISKIELDGILSEGVLASERELRNK